MSEEKPKVKIVRPWVKGSAIALTGFGVYVIVKNFILQPRSSKIV